MLSCPRAELAFGADAELMLRLLQWNVWGVGCGSHCLCDLSSFPLNSEEWVLFKSCPGKELPHDLRRGVKCLWQGAEPLQGGHLYHQKLNQECPFLSKQTGKGIGWCLLHTADGKGLPWAGWSILSSRGSGQALCHCRGMFHLLRAVHAFCKGKKKWGCAYIFMNIFKLQSTRQREGGGWCNDLEIGELRGN